MTHLRRGLGLLLLLLCLPAPVFAQWGYVGYAQTTVTNTAGGVPLPAAQITDSSHMRPSQVFCFVEDAEIRWTIDGTAPTASVGNVAAADTALPAISGTTLLSNFRAIRTGGTNASLSCNYFAGGSLPFREWGIGSVVTGGGGGSGGLTDSELRATAVPISVASLPSHAVTNAGTFAVQVSSAPTTTVTGTVTVDRGTGWGTDPCAGTASSVAIDTATSANNQLVALSGSTLVYVCGFHVVADGTVTVQFVSGTGTACATGETDKTGPMAMVANGINDAGFGGSTLFKGAAGEAMCIELSTTVGARGFLSYVQQ